MVLIKNNLTIRVITSIILIPILLLLIVKLPQISFGVVTGFIILLAGTEWPKLMGKDGLYNIMLFICVQIGFMAAGLFLLQFTGHNGWMSVVYFVLIFCMWLVYSYWVLYFERHGKLPIKQPLFIGLLGLFILMSWWLGLNIIRDVLYGKFFVLYVLVLIWGADTTAYFTGKRWGKAKITPTVSPNKTWEGVYGALIFSLIIGLIGAMSFPIDHVQRVLLIPLSVIVVIFSIVGDLTISMFKRQQKLKDTGALLPGHGGLLDRIDSLTAGVPVFALGLLLIGLQ